MNRFKVALPAVVAALLFSPVAFAKDITETNTLTKPNGTKVSERTTLNTKTDVTTETTKTTRKDGDTKTITDRFSPAVQGGFNVSKTTTGFNGQTHSSSSHVGGGKKH